MTLAAPRSRQGKLMLVLAFLAATVAVVGTLLWAQSARADIPQAGPGTVVTVTDNVSGTLNPGDIVTYTVTVTSPIGTGVTTNTTFEMDPDPNLYPLTVSTPGGVWDDAECYIGPPPPAQAGLYYNTVKCVDPTGPINNDTITITFMVLGIDEIISNPSYCEVYDDGTGSASCTFTGLEDATVAIAATNAPGAAHTIDFPLPAGVTCDSDADATDGTRECAAADVNITNSNGATATLVSGPTLSDTSYANNATATVVINSPTEGDVQVQLNVKAVDDDGQVPVFIDISGNETFLKTYSILAPGSNAAVIRHLDIPDAATEDAADIDIDDTYCPGTGATTTLTTCGILFPQDDIDDAIGSFHGACIEGTTLTYDANAAQVEWQITPVPPGTGPAPAGVLEFEGPNDEPCVMWSAATPGTQQITATFDPDGPGGVGATTFFWDTVLPIPLIKEWNDIDVTRIISVSGNVGDTLADNTGDLASWSARDCIDTGFCVEANMDGLTLDVGCFIITGSINGNVNCPTGGSFIDYTFGDHSDAGGAYSGPIDGAQQTYSIDGPCGSLRVEDPTTGDAHIVLPGNSVTVLTSDKGVGFQILPNDDGALTTTPANADCGPLAEICVTISTVEDNLFRSPPLDTADDEEVCIRLLVGPPTNKTPILAWAGQRVVVEADWADYSGGTRVCPDYDDDANAPTGAPGDREEFGVLYSRQNGPGSFTAQLAGNPNDVDQVGSDSLVDVNRDPADENQDGVTDPNSNCTSRVIYESQDEGQVDIIAYPTSDSDSLASADPLGQQQAFVIYYMKLEDVTLGLVPGTRSGHNSGQLNPANPIDPANDTTTVTANVSQDVLARVRVRGWVETTNCPTRESRTGSNGEFIPANRCIFPDDWRFKAGGALAEEQRPNFDIMNTPPTAPTPTCSTVGGGAAGPFSLLDRVPRQLQPSLLLAPPMGAGVDGNVCNDSLAPHVVGGTACRGGGLSYNCRETVFPNGTINNFDAPMPPSLIRLLLSGAGFIRPADKDDIYPNNSNPFYVTHIPAEPWITPINQDLSGYQWNTWGGPGGKSGPYEFWTSLADSSAEVVSCPGNPGGASNCTSSNLPCPNPPTGNPPSGLGCLTGGYKMIKIYSDNHGEAMAWVNGDADLDFSGCNDSADTPLSRGTGLANIVLINGFYCPTGTTVGTSTLTASADYPDKRKHFPIDSNDVTITWTWGGIKDVTIEPVPGNAQFNYVVFHVTDRDGFCDAGVSQHPVLGETVTFMIDQPGGTIVDAELNGAPLPATQGVIVTTTTFDADSNPAIARTKLAGNTGEECQAWALVSASALALTNVVITAYDPEGVITFDIVINPTPTPSPTPTDSPAPPTATPFAEVTWGDWDCSGAVDIGDAVIDARITINLTFTPPAGCPTMEETLSVTQDGITQDLMWGDVDCDDVIDIGDAIKLARSLINLPNEIPNGCPGLNQEVKIPA